MFRNQNKAFTLIELISTIAIIAVVAIVGFFYLGPVILSVRQNTDKEILYVLNEAVNRYKCQGGDVNSLTAGAPISHVLAKMATTLDWAGHKHQVMQKGTTYAGRSIDSKGDRAQYRFTRYNTYTAESGGSSPTGDSGSAEPGNMWVVNNQVDKLAKLDGSAQALAVYGPSLGGSYGTFLGNDGIFLAVDPATNDVWVSDVYNARLVKINSSGVTQAVYGPSLGGSFGSLGSPGGMAISQGCVYVADGGNTQVVKLNTSGVTQAVYGPTVGGSVGTLNWPSGLALDGSGNIWLTDIDLNQVIKLSSAGAGLAAYGPALGGSYGSLNTPSGIAISGNNLWVVDSMNNRVVKLDASNGTTLGVYGPALGGSFGSLFIPSQVAIDGSGNVWITDTLNNRLVKLDGSTGATLATYSSMGGSFGNFQWPTGIAIY